MDLKLVVPEKVRNSQILNRNPFFRSIDFKLTMKCNLILVSRLSTSKKTINVSYVRRLQIINTPSLALQRQTVYPSFDVITNK